MHADLEPYGQFDPEVDSPVQMLLNALKATLHCPTSPSAKAKKLALDIVYFATATDHDQPEFWEVWPIIFYTVSRIPAGHEWHTCFIEAIEILRNTEDPIYISDVFPSDVIAKLKNVNMQDLPEWTISTTEWWNGMNNPDCSETVESSELDRWRNLNSFLARLSGRGYIGGLNRCTYELRAALEEPPRNDSYDDPLSVCRVWVVCEYLTQAGEQIWARVLDPEDHFDLSSSGSTWGSLCNDIDHRSAKQRWSFWKEQLGRIESKTSTNKDKIEEAIKAMDRVEQDQKRP